MYHPIYSMYDFRLSLHLYVCVYTYIHTHTHTHTHIYIYIYIYIYISAPGCSAVKNHSTHAGDEGLIPGSGRYPGEGSSNPLQYSCLGNHMNRKPLAGYS